MILHRRDAGYAAGRAAEEMPSAQPLCPPAPPVPVLGIKS